MDGNLVIDCDDCMMQDTETCADCIVTYLCTHGPGESIVVDVAEVRAFRRLNDAGLVPGLRHRRSATG